MPYDKTQDLPESVREHLPQHAQVICRAAYDNAWEAYKHDETRAHRAAWAAVEKKYRKDKKTGDWKTIGSG
jgi:cation transport regulator